MLLDKVKTIADNKNGLRMVICGNEKIGKTTFCCQAPDPLLVPLERGYDGIVADFPTLPIYDDIPNFNSVIALLAELCQSEHPYKTIILDSATALERMLHEQLISADPRYAVGNPNSITMETILGGYGKGYTFANEQWANLLRWLDILTEKGVNVVLTCHIIQSKAQDSETGEYDFSDLSLHSPKNAKTTGKREMTAQWADIIGYMRTKLAITEVNNIQKATATQARVLEVERAPGHIAGNRYKMKGCIELPDSAEGEMSGWNHFAKALYESTSGAINDASK